MKHGVNILVLIALLAMVVAPKMAMAKVESKVFTYSTVPELRLTRYVDPAVQRSNVPAPCIIFAFGGGFTHGERDAVRYLPYFRFMADRGYVVCTIDYRTTLAGFNPSGGMQAFGEALVAAINTATTDFITATAYILGKAKEWNVDPAKIIASGSSAGAITAIQASYTMAGGIPAGFPEKFNYAATVSFAGALLSEGAPEIKPNLCPMMLFQGDADRQVPYNSLVLGPIGLYGSNYLASAIKSAGGEGAFWTVLGAGHEMSEKPMTENLYDIEGFLHHVLAHGRKQFAVTTVTIPHTAPYQTEFSIADYIQANMPSKK